MVSSRECLSSPNLLQANVVLGLIVHIKYSSDTESDGLLNRVHIAPKRMNMRIDESGHNSASGFDVCRGVFRNGCLS